MAASSSTAIGERLKSHQDVQEFYLGQAGGERRTYRDVKQYRRIAEVVWLSLRSSI